MTDYAADTTRFKLCIARCLKVLRIRRASITLAACREPLRSCWR